MSPYVKIERVGNSSESVLAFLRRNGGVVTHAEALALGMSPATVTRWVQRGHLVAVNRGTYVLPGVLGSERTLLRAAARALSAVVSHESAARLHGIDGLDPRRVTITVPVRRSNRFADAIVHQLTDLTVDETTEVLGLPVTDPPRTIVDLAAVLTTPLLAACLDQAARSRLTTYDQVAERLERVARRGKPGVTKLRKVLTVRLGTNFVSDSTLETHLLRVLADRAVPTPTTQFRPSWLKRVNGRVDLAYVVERVVVEGDSQRWHGSPDVFQSDRTRDNLAQLAGWIILRFTWADITTRPDYVAETVRRALSRRSGDQI